MSLERQAYIGASGRLGDGEEQVTVESINHLAARWGQAG
jgi:hypothetical protein